MNPAFLATCAFLVSVVPALSQPISVDADDLQSCFDKTVRLDRLACYDRLLENPITLIPTITAPNVESIVNPKVLAGAVRRAREKLVGHFQSNDGVAVSVINRTTGEQAEIPGAVTEEPLARLATAATQEQFRQTTDIYLALGAIEDAGEAGILLVSCKNNITQLRVQWDRPFRSNFIDTRFHLGTEIGLGGEVLSQRMRVLGDGHLLVAPRGLESIRLLTRLVGSNRFQVSTENGANIRSIFFNASALRSVLGLVARQCSWSVQTFGREF